MKSSDDVLDALANIGFSDEPSPDVVKGCEKFICKLFSAEFSDADKLRWHLFKHLKNQQSIENLPPTPGSIEQSVHRAHLHTYFYHTQ